MVKVARRQLCQFGRQFRCRLIRHVGERVCIGQFAHLLGYRIRHFLAAQSDVGAPHTANGIEVFFAVDIVQACVATFVHDE